MKDLNKSAFFLAVLREIERQNMALFVEIIQQWQIDNCVLPCYLIRLNSQEQLEDYIKANFEVGSYEDSDTYITVSDGRFDKVITSSCIDELIDLRVIADDIALNKMEYRYFGFKFD